MRRTLLFVSAGLVLAWVLAPPAVGDTQTIPVSCKTVSEVQSGWERSGKSISEFWIDYENPVPSENGYIWHIGTGNFLAYGDTYCRGFWYFDGGWYLEAFAEWPPMEGDGHLWGSVDMKLSHANIDGGWIFTYEGDFIWDVENNRVWAGSGSGEGYGELKGWEISLDVYLPYYPPAGKPGGPQQEVWTGHVTPPEG
ncbi:MAG TPA: hypothetical protein VF984_06750 [Actinomycetota bacterium]